MPLDSYYPPAPTTGGAGVDQAARDAAAAAQATASQAQADATAAVNEAELAAGANGSLATGMGVAAVTTTGGSRAMTLPDRNAFQLSAADFAGFDNRGGADQAPVWNAILARAQLMAEQWLSTSAIPYGWTVFWPPGVYRFDTTPTAVTVSGMRVVGPEARFVFTPTSGKFLEFLRPLYCVIDGLELINGTVQAGSTIAGRARVTVAPYDGVGTTAIALSWTNSGGSTNNSHRDMLIRGFELGVEIAGTANGDNFWFDRVGWLSNNRDFHSTNSNNQVITFINCRFDYTITAAIDDDGGFRFLFIQPEVILPGIFIRLNVGAATNVGRPQVEVIGGKQEGYLIRDNTKKPKLIQINGGAGTNHFGVIFRGFGTPSITFDQASRYVEVNNANANILFEDCGTAGKFYLQAASAINSNDLGLINELRFVRCYPSPAVADITLDLTNMGSTHSSHPVIWQDCPGVLNYNIGGGRRNRERNQSHEIRVAPGYSAIRSFNIASSVYHIVFPGRVLVDSIRAVITDAAVAGPLSGTGNACRAWSDAGLTAAVGTPFSPTVIESSQDLLTGGAGVLLTDLYLEGFATAAAGEIPGYWLVRFRSAAVPP